MLRPLLLAFLLCFSGIPAEANRSPLGVAASLELTSIRLSEHPNDPRPTFSVTPVVANHIPNQTRSLQAGSFTIELSEVFEDTDGNDLRFSAVSNKTDIATAAVNGTTLIVTPQALGSCRIRATARDDDDDKADDTFTLTIISNEPPELTPEANLRDIVLFAQGSPLILDLSTVFQDPEGDDLEFRAESSEEQIAQVDLDDETLTIIPDNTGKALITLSASDPIGGVILEQFLVDVILSYPATLAAGVEVSFDDYRDQGSYRMIALAGDQSALISDMIPGRHQEDWVAYAANPADDGALIPYERSERFTLGPGNGIWLLSKNDWQQSFRTIPTVALNDQSAYEIPLHPGWNIISNPFDVDLAWENVQKMNEASQGIWRWRDGYESMDTLYSAVREAEAFYFNNLENLESLQLPYIFGNSIFSSENAGKNIAGKNIAGKQIASAATERLTVSATSIASAKQSRVFIDWSTEASIGFDKLDQLAPPAHFTDLHLALSSAHEDFNDAALAVEARPFDDTLHQYDLILHASPGDQVFFNLAYASDVHAGDLTLVNLLDRQTFPLATLQENPVFITHEETPFSLLIGSTQDIEQALDKLAPQLFTLKQNYPNPFNPTTTIEYSIPESQYVNLSIYDMMGRQIVTLHDGEQSAGFHRIQWNGADQSQNNVANGVYFYRLQTALWTKSLKMTLIR